jgi:DNA-directed RNA polymerase sigma subunit (sigma70/sigma32)
MSGIKYLADIYEKKGKDFIEKLFSQELSVTENLDGSSFSFERDFTGDNISFYKKDQENPITKVDRILMRYYEKPINYIESLEKTDESLNNDDIKKMIASILNELKPIEKKIIILRYGLDNHGEESNFKSIGEEMGKTTEWARTICRKAEKKIKVIVRRRKIKEMLF